MSEKIKRCEACSDPFRWNDEIIIVDDTLYHKDCVSLYPSGYIAMLDGEFLGETENEDGNGAYDILNDGEYLEATE
ncbi:hypothetical protein K0H71_15040 [Bacillus sp. IITD106]|nr:hypothetical protein [Bacillus sp. IITD106]